MEVGLPGGLLAVAIVLSGCATGPPGAPSAPPGSEPVLGTLAIDPVVLVDRGTEVPGQAALQSVRGPFRYRFASEESQRRFEAGPELYGIRLGGACARMGALSGVGSPSIYAVHDGGLYLFASEACRATFLADPAAVLEPERDPRPRPTIDGAERAQRLLQRVVAGIGGAERLAAVAVEWSLEEIVEHEGADHRQARRVLLAPGARMRQESSWDDRQWVKVLDGDAGFFVDPESGARSMVQAQVRAAKRLAQGHLVHLLRQPDLEPGISSVDGDGTVLTLYSDGVAHRLGVTDDGRVLWHEHLAWGPAMALGTLRRTFERWRHVAGVMVPVAWSRQFDGAEWGGVDREAAGYALRALAGDVASEFVRPVRD